MNYEIYLLNKPSVLVMQNDSRLAGMRPVPKVWRLGVRIPKTSLDDMREISTVGKEKFNEY